MYEYSNGIPCILEPHKPLQLYPVDQQQFQVFKGYYYTRLNQFLYSSEMISSEFRNNLWKLLSLNRFKLYEGNMLCQLCFKFIRSPATLVANRKTLFQICIDIQMKKCVVYFYLVSFILWSTSSNNWWYELSQVQSLNNMIFIGLEFKTVLTIHARCRTLKTLSTLERRLYKMLHLYQVLSFPEHTKQRNISA